VYREQSLTTDRQNLAKVQWFHLAELVLKAPYDMYSKERMSGLHGGTAFLPQNVPRFLRLLHAQDTMGITSSTKV